MYIYIKNNIFIKKIMKSEFYFFWEKKNKTRKKKKTSLKF